jgi:hypothetical protein
METVPDRTNTQLTVGLFTEQRNASQLSSHSAREIEPEQIERKAKRYYPDKRLEGTDKRTNAFLKEVQCRNSYNSCTVQTLSDTFVCLYLYHLKISLVNAL